MDAKRKAICRRLREEAKRRKRREIMKWSKRVLYVLGIFGWWAATTTEAQGQPIEPVVYKENTKMWTSINLGSKHYEAQDKRGNKKKYNEKNYGVGMEYEDKEDWKWAAGVYQNSVFETSLYASRCWVPEIVRVNSFKIRGGACLSLVTGYGRPILPVPTPTLGIEAGQAGANFIIVPAYKGREWLVGYQVKFQ